MEGKGLKEELGTNDRKTALLNDKLVIILKKVKKCQCSAVDFICLFFFFCTVLAYLKNTLHNQHMYLCAFANNLC